MEELNTTSVVQDFITVVDVPDADENDEENDGAKEDTSQKTLEGLAANEAVCAGSLCSFQLHASLAKVPRAPCVIHDDT